MNSTRRDNRASAPGPRGFTLIELMVVVGIIILLVSVAVPAFSAMSYSTQRSLAENSLRRAVTVARDLSLRSERGGDGAVAFLFDPGGRVRIAPAEQVGELLDVRENPATSELQPGRGPRIVRDVFVPSGGIEAIQLPRYWTVRGYAPPASMLDSMSDGSEISEWYATDMYGGSSPSGLAKLEGNWVFPESGFYDVDAASHGDPGAAGRQTFMVRFDALTGAISRSTRGALLVDPRPSAEDRDAIAPSDPGAWTRVDRADDLTVWAQRVLTDPDPNGDGRAYTAEDTRRRLELAGKASNDTVLMKPVTRLALADERRVARGVRARGLNGDTQSLYKPFRRGQFRSEYDGSVFGLADGALDLDQVRKNINSWIIGDTANDDDAGSNSLSPNDPIGDGEINLDPDDTILDDNPEAAVFVISPYTGELREVNP